MKLSAEKKNTVAEKRLTIKNMDQLFVENDSIYSQIDQSNWKAIAFKELELDTIVVKYLENYISRNEKALHSEWAKSMRQFLKLHMEGMYDEYFQVFTSKLVRYPDNYCVEYALGEYYYKGKGKVLEAREHWLKADLLLPENAKCKMYLAFIYNSLGDFEKSYHYNEKVLDNIKNEEILTIQIESQCLFNLGLILLKYHDDKKRAKELIQKAVKIRPDYVYAKKALKSL